MKEKAAPSVNRALNAAVWAFVASRMAGSAGPAGTGPAGPASEGAAVLYDAALHLEARAGQVEAAALARLKADEAKAEAMKLTRVRQPIKRPVIEIEI